MLIIGTSQKLTGQNERVQEDLELKVNPKIFRNFKEKFCRVSDQPIEL
jgi:hypothetical protein